MKYAPIWNGVMAVFYLTNMNLFTSETYFDAQLDEWNSLLETWTGGNLFIAKRYAQGHVILFYVIIVIIILMMKYDGLLSSLLVRMPCIRVLYQVPLSKKEALSNNFYEVIQPEFLLKQYLRSLEVKDQLIAFVAANQHKGEFFDEFRKDIAVYLKQTQEKELALANKIRLLAKRMGYSQFSDMQSRCEKIMSRIDKANEFSSSRMVSQLQSYDYRDNEFYQPMLALEEVLQELPAEDEKEANEEAYVALKECFKN